MRIWLSYMGHPCHWCRECSGAHLGAHHGSRRFTSPTTRWRWHRTGDRRRARPGADSTSRMPGEDLGQVVPWISRPHW